MADSGFGLDPSGFDPGSVDPGSFDPGAIDFSSLPVSEPSIPLDPSISLDNNLTTDPGAIAPDPGLFGTVGDAGVGSETATADNLNSAEQNFLDGNTVIGFEDGSNYDTTTGQLFDHEGNPIQETGIDSDGFQHFADGSVVDPITGQRVDSSGSLVASQGSTGPAASGNGSASRQSGGGSLGSSGPSGAKPGNPNVTKPQNPTGFLAALSKALGSLGAGITSVLSKPTAPTARQLALQQATATGLPSNLSATGTVIFAVGALVVISLLIRSK